MITSPRITGSQRATTAAAVLAAVLLLVVCSGCLFETRPAGDPGENPPTWVPPDNPAVVFANLTTGLEDRTGVNYTRSLEAGFSFSPLLEDSLEQSLQGQFDDWDRAVEEDVTNRLVSDADSIGVTFSQSFEISEADFARFRVEYELIVVASADGSRKTYKGVAELDTIRGSRGWELSHWRDTEKVAGFSTWGFLRGSLRTP